MVIPISGAASIRHGRIARSREVINIPRVTFLPDNRIAAVELGSSLIDAAKAAGVEVGIPCGGQGRCGRCKVRIDGGRVDSPGTALINGSMASEGWVLACKAAVIEDITVSVPPSQGRETPVGESRADRLALAADWQGVIDPSVSALYLDVPPPSLEDSVDDLSRLQREFSRNGLRHVSVEPITLRSLPDILRASNWQVTAYLDSVGSEVSHRLISLRSGDRRDRLYGAAIDIGTTTVVVYLVDLRTARILEVASAYNEQIARGEDVISRIVYSIKGENLKELQRLVVGTINELLKIVQEKTGVEVEEVVQVVAAGNPTMSHLLHGISPRYMREQPYIPAVNQYPPVQAYELGLKVNPNALVLTLPGVASYVGGDITAGVLSSGLWNTDKLTLFIDVGTNGEIVLGNSDWQMACACSAGPAFEGAGVRHGMRASTGAIEKVDIDRVDFEPRFHVIGDVAPRGICGSAMIDLLAEMFLSGVVDRAGKMDLTLGTPRVRKGDHGGEYVVAWGGETADGQEIFITEVDVNNLLRTKAAIYAGFSVLVGSVGLSFSDIEQVLIGGGFGRYINVEKAIQIGLLPDLPWDTFRYLGNTSARGAYESLVSNKASSVAERVATGMTYLELSVDSRFMDEYISGIFLPHTDLAAFPSVEKLLREKNGSLR